MTLEEFNEAMREKFPFEGDYFSAKEDGVVLVFKDRRYTLVSNDDGPVLRRDDETIVHEIASLPGPSHR